MENLEEIQRIASECMNCKSKPCSKACPLSNDIPTFIKYIRENDFISAYKTLSETTIMPSICGRICPHSKQCEGSCIRGIKKSPVQIGKLEAFVGDIYLSEKQKKYINESISSVSDIPKFKVAIVGSGPAGITCAAVLACKGCDVTIYVR
jgi:glutamate synthase (NADPH/NADH) small chain